MDNNSINTFFIDNNVEVIRALVEQFSKKQDLIDNSIIKFIVGDIFEPIGNDSSDKYYTLVSPANSKGNMDGGIDLIYREKFPNIEDRLSRFIQNNHAGTLQIGEAQIIPTDDTKYPHIIFSPTINNPGDLATYNSVYQAVMATYREAHKFNREIGSRIPHIRNLLIPGFGTLYGNLPYSDSARAMCDAYIRSNVYKE